MTMHTALHFPPLVHKSSFTFKREIFKLRKHLPTFKKEKVWLLCDFHTSVNVRAIFIKEKMNQSVKTCSQKFIHKREV